MPWMPRWRWDSRWRSPFRKRETSGGGGFMLIRMANGDAMVVDYREQAPAAATREMYQDAQGNLIPGASTKGARAAGVPGTVRGLALAEEKYGHLGLARVMAPAIRLARNGFPVSYSLARHFSSAARPARKASTARATSFCMTEILTRPAQFFANQTWRARSQPSPSVVHKPFIPARLPRPSPRPCKSTMALSREEDLEHYQAKLRPPLVGPFSRL